MGTAHWESKFFVYSHGLAFGYSFQLLTFSAGILEQSLGARNRVGIGLSYRPARLRRLEDRFLGSIPGHLKSLKIPSQAQF
jgi:hypothetical protein